jgi:vacuolar-type H+-ATPase subunit F/Vma7
VGRFVVIGEASRVAGFELGGATVVRADTADAVQRAWDTLPGDAAVVVLTPDAAALLVDRLRHHEQALIAVMPP